MPRKDDIRFDQRPIKVEHQSARGETFRGIGEYARGAQLKIMGYKLLLGGLQPPLMVALGSFALLLVLLLTLLMAEHEIQQVEMRCFAGLWQFVGLDPEHIINVTLTDGSVEPMEIGDVSTYPDVARAVTKFLRCILVALAGSAALTAPLTTWFVKVSRKTSADALEDRHERGSTLVSTDVLTAAIEAYNDGEFRKELAEQHPDWVPELVAAAPIIERVEEGIHVPYRIAGVPYPWRFEQTHAMLVGSTGTGKTTILKDIIVQARERGHRCVIFDLTGTFVQSFYREGHDVILNSMDERCPPWTLFDECRNYVEFASAATALIPSPDGGGDDPFWVDAARTMFVETCAKLVAKGQTTNAAIVHGLMTANIEELYKTLYGTVAAPLVNPKAPRLTESVRSVFNTNANAMRFLPDPVPGGRPPFSIRKWVEYGEPGSILFITAAHVDLEFNRQLVTLWVDLAINTLMMLEQGRDLRMWFLFDEVHALHRLKSVEHGLQTARSFGGGFIMGMHSFDKLAETYGEKGAHNLGSLARTKVIMATGDKNTADFGSDAIGDHDVREIDEAYSIGATRARDAATLTPRTSTKPLMLASDIKDMPSMTGVIKFPEGFPAGRITIKWVNYPKIAPSRCRVSTMWGLPMNPPPASADVEEPADSGPHMRADGKVDQTPPVEVPPQDRTLDRAKQPDLFTAADQREAQAAMAPAAEIKPAVPPPGAAGGLTEPPLSGSGVLDGFRQLRSEQDMVRASSTAEGQLPLPDERRADARQTGMPRTIQQISIEELTGQAFVDPNEKSAHHHQTHDHGLGDHGIEDDGMDLER